MRGEIPPDTITRLVTTPWIKLTGPILILEADLVIGVDEIIGVIGATAVVDIGEAVGVAPIGVLPDTVVVRRIAIPGVVGSLSPPWVTQLPTLPPSNCFLQFALGTALSLLSRTPVLCVSRNIMGEH